MAFVLETGAGTPGANAYATPTFVTTYLTERGREEEGDWAFKVAADQQEAIVKATDYIDKRFGHLFRGVKLLSLIGGRQATGSLTLGSLPLDTETFTAGLVTYRLVTTLAQENDVLIGSSATETAENIVSAINGASDGSGALYDSLTRVNFEIFASSSSAVVTMTARAKGENANAIPLTTTITGATLSGATLSGGLDEGEQPLQFPRSKLYTPDGTLVTGIPPKLRQATAEYAVRVLSSVLAPDPETDDRLALVQRKREVVGPIEEETEYASGATQSSIKAYPEADKLLSEYLVGVGGRVLRG